MVFLHACLSDSRYTTSTASELRHLRSILVHHGGAQQAADRDGAHPRWEQPDLCAQQGRRRPPSFHSPPDPRRIRCFCFMLPGSGR